MFANLKPLVLPILMMPVMIGCSAEATRIAREAADRQAQQNTTMADLNKEVASGSHQLVAADAQARQGIVDVHHDLQAERGRLDTAWSALQGERQQVAQDRRTESFLVAMWPLLGGSLAVATLLGFCWWLLVSATANSRVDARLNDVLLAEILPSESTLILPDTSTSRQRLLD